VVLTSSVVEFLAELHHVEAEGSQSLTNFGVGLRISSEAVNANSGFIGGSRIHLKV